MIAASENNLKYLKNALGFSTIGYDKLNQLRHLRFFGGKFENLVAHMKKHKALIAPKFRIVENTLERELADWASPAGRTPRAATSSPSTRRAAQSALSSCARRQA